MTNKLKFSVPSDYQEIPAYQQLVGSLFHHPSLTLLYAASGQMKSFFALSFAKAVAEGSSFAGHRVNTPRKVIYLDSELSPQCIKNRLSTLQLTDCANLAFLTPENSGLNLTEKDDQLELLNHVKAFGAELVVIDNIRTSTQIVETAADEITPLNQFIKHLRDIGVSVLVIHHKNKDGVSFAGSSNILTVFDFAISLENHTDSIKQVTVIKDRENTLPTINGGYLSLTNTGITHYQHTTGVDYSSIVPAIEAQVLNGSLVNKENIKRAFRDAKITVKNDKDTEQLADWFSQYGLTDKLISKEKLLTQLRVNRAFIETTPQPFPETPVVEVEF